MTFEEQITLRWKPRKLTRWDVNLWWTTRCTHSADGWHYWLKTEKMDELCMWHPGFHPDVYMPAPGNTMQTQQSKGNITQILILGGKESKVRILDTLLQRHLEYSILFESKTHKSGAQCGWTRAYKVFMSTTDMQVSWKRQHCVLIRKKPWSSFGVAGMMCSADEGVMHTCPSQTCRKRLD